MTTNLRSKNRAFFAKIFPGNLLLAAFVVLLFCGSSLGAWAKPKLVFPPIYYAGINGFAMTPQFDVNINNYTATVPDSVTSVTLFVGIINYDPSGNNGSPINPALAINGQPVVTNNQPGGGGTFVIPLAVGITVVQFGLDSANASRSFSQNYPYTLTIVRAAGPLSSDATLSALSAVYVSNGFGVNAVTSPAFDNNVTSYTASVPNNVDSLFVSAQANNTFASVAISPTPSQYTSIALSPGLNTIKFTVLAEDGFTTKTYTLAVTRGGTSGGTKDATLKSLAYSNGTSISNPDTYGNLSFVPYGVSSFTVTPLTNDPLATVTVNGLATPYGSSSAAIPLSVGDNNINIAVVSSDGTATITYYVVVTRGAPSSNANLASLALSNGTLSPSFAIGTMSYSASVANGVTSIMVTPTTSDATATVTVNGAATPSGSASAAIPLAVGTNTITTVLTAQDGTTIKIYTVTVTRAPSSNANLASLALSNGTLSPAFASGTTGYSASVANNITSITVTPTTSDATATVTVNSAATPSGSASAAIPLTVGANTITTSVTAQDGTTIKTYTVTVTRAPSGNANLANLALSNGTLSPSFASGTMSYSASVANNITSITVMPTTSDATATVTVNGVLTASGSASQAFNISVGASTFSTVVTAQDGTTKTYTITVTRAGSSNALLGNLYLNIGTLSPSFASGTMSYNASVANNVTSISAYPVSADAKATITVNGVPTPSFSASAPIPLNVGANTITIVVTAEDGTTTGTYTVTVTRDPLAPPPPLGNSLLSKLIIDYGTLSPSFASGVMNYNVSVPNSVILLSVYPTPSDPAATVTVNNQLIMYPDTGGYILLSVGANTITTVVTASDGLTTSTYKMIVTRAEPGKATLSALKLSAGTINPSFVSTTTNYKVSVSNSITTFAVTPTASNPASLITVNGIKVLSGSQSPALPLSIGANNITIVVSNSFGSKTYTVTVTRVLSEYAYLANLQPGSGSLSPAFAYATLNYNVRVGRTIYSFTVTPTTLYPFETVKVNGLPVASGTASQAIALADGLNNISIVVTAQNGTNTRAYTLLVTKEAGAAYSFYPAYSLNSEPQNNPPVVSGIKVHQGISPNGDGIDDALLIEGIALYPQNKFRIMDRNGVLVYEADGYDNISRVFDGHSSKNGKMLEPGTYYYSLEYSAGKEKKQSTGFLILKF